MALEVVRPEMRVGNSYDILFVGECPIESVLVEYDETDVARLTDAQAEELDEMVTRRVEQGDRIDRDAQGRMPDLYRVIECSGSAEGGLLLTTGRTNYGEYLLTNVEHPDWRERYGQGVMSDALAFSVVTLTADNLALFGPRTKKPADCKNMFHVAPSGHPHPPQSLTHWILEEFRSETGITAGEVGEGICSGFVRPCWNYKPELTFLYRVSVALSEVLEREPEEKWEFAEIRGLPWDESTVTAWLIENLQTTVPPGHAALLFAGKATFGSFWYEETLRQLETSHD